MYDRARRLVVDPVSTMSMALRSMLTDHYPTERG